MSKFTMVSLVALTATMIFLSPTDSEARRRNATAVMCASDDGHFSPDVEMALHRRADESMAFAACRDTKIAYEKTYGYPRKMPNGQLRALECFAADHCPRN